MMHSSGNCERADEYQFTGENRSLFLTGTSTGNCRHYAGYGSYLSVAGRLFRPASTAPAITFTDLTQVVWGTLTLIGGEGRRHH